MSTAASSFAGSRSELLVSAACSRPEQLQHALEAKAAAGRRLGEIVVELGFTTERGIAGALAEQYELEFVDLDVAELDKRRSRPAAEELARRYEALPLRILEDGMPLLAVTDPTNLATADDLRFALGSSFRIAVAERGQIDLAIARAYRRSLQLITEDAATTRPRRSAPTTSARSPRARRRSTSSTRSWQPRSRRAHPTSTSSRGARTCSSAIRVDGVMRELATVPKPHAAGGHEPAEDHGQARHRRPPRAEGRARVRVLRHAAPSTCGSRSCPTTHGEQVVLRHPQPRRPVPSIAGLEMEPRRGGVPDRDRAALRHRDRLRADRLGQDDHALRRDRPSESAATAS